MVRVGNFRLRTAGTEFTRKRSSCASGLSFRQNPPLPWVEVTKSDVGLRERDRTPGFLDRVPSLHGLQAFAAALIAVETRVEAAATASTVLTRNAVGKYANGHV